MIRFEIKLSMRFGRDGASETENETREHTGSTIETAEAHRIGFVIPSSAPPFPYESGDRMKVKR